jgi:hypothetical protein
MPAALLSPVPLIAVLRGSEEVFDLTEYAGGAFDTQLEQYSSLDKKGSDWDIQLRGACP